jgi:imidazoleglycerol phosphate synthase glutamine amidotransferase subunit HisH
MKHTSLLRVVHHLFYFVHEYRMKRVGTKKTIVVFQFINYNVAPQ